MPPLWEYFDSKTNHLRPGVAEIWFFENYLETQNFWCCCERGRQQDQVCYIRFIEAGQLLFQPIAALVHSGHSIWLNNVFELYDVKTLKNIMLFYWMWKKWVWWFILSFWTWWHKFKKNKFGQRYTLNKFCCYDQVVPL